MKALLASLTLLFAVTAHADYVKCTFTEPFYSLEIDTEGKTLTLTDYDLGTTVLSTNVEIKKLKSKVLSNVLEVPSYQVLADGKEVLVLVLDYQGSDGMSDYAYPYSTKHGNNYGGCNSSQVPTHKFDFEE